MGFDADRFESTEFVARTKRVAVPALADFFDGDDCQWEVRGLSSNELHKAISAGNTNKSIEKILEALTESGDQVTALRKAIGLERGTPGEVAKRLEMLTAGSVDPVITLSQGVKLAESFPIEFMTLTNAITKLTGMGFEHAKPQAALLETAS